MLYLAAGFALGPAGWAVLGRKPLNHADVVERIPELAAVFVSIVATESRYAR